jgi:hypothetical protein
MEGFYRKSMLTVATEPPSCMSPDASLDGETIELLTALPCLRVTRSGRSESIATFETHGLAGKLPGDAEVLIAALHRDWGELQGNYDELRFFTGLRPSEEIALVVTEYDAAHGVLSITKARVGGIDKNVTKTGEDRRIVLCPRAIAVIERQLRLREHVVQAGLIEHQDLFFTHSGAPIPNVKYPYWPWHSTLRRLALRYRKPYMARHTSVSWNLMIGRNPLLVAKEHGHRIATMLSVYAAWTEGAVEADITAIREAMNRTGSTVRTPRGSNPVPPPQPPVWTTLTPGHYAITLRVDSSALGRWVETRRLAEHGAPSALSHPPQRGGEVGDAFASEFASGTAPANPSYLNFMRKYGGADGTRIRLRRLGNQ